MKLGIPYENTGYTHRFTQLNIITCLLHKQKLCIRLIKLRQSTAQILKQGAIYNIPEDRQDTREKFFLSQTGNRTRYFSITTTASATCLKLITIGICQGSPTLQPGVHSGTLY